LNPPVEGSNPSPVTKEKVKMQTKWIEVEVGNNLVPVEAVQLPDLTTWIVNGTLKDIEFEDGTLLQAVLDFGSVFKCTVAKTKRRDSAGVVFYKQDVYSTIKQDNIVNDVVKQLPEDCFVVVSSKSLRGFKNVRMICAERNGSRARTVFEVMP
jgi:hypothetical protein